MTRDIVLLGGGGHASDMLAVIEALRPGTLVHVADDGQVDPRRFSQRAAVHPGTLRDAMELDAVFFSAIGYPQTRSKIVTLAEKVGVEWSRPLIDPAATVHSSVNCGHDVVVFGQTWVSPHVTIGAHTNVSYGVTIGHDTSIANGASIMPGACIGGDVVVGSEVLVGANATILQGLKIGPGAVVGAGAVVTRDVDAGDTVVGIPARGIDR